MRIIVRRVAHYLLCLGSLTSNKIKFSIQDFLGNVLPDITYPGFDNHNRITDLIESQYDLDADSSLMAKRGMIC